MSGAIWLASYPKSGNTWTRLALRSLAGGGAAIDLDDLAGFSPMTTRRELFDQLLEVESSHLTDDEIAELRPALHRAYFARLRGPQPTKVHDAWFRTPSGAPVFAAECTAATVYVLRDPRDVALSWARFAGVTIDAAIEFLANPRATLGGARDRISSQLRQPLGRWCDHVTSWIDESRLAPLVVRYEDLHADTAGTLARIVAHLGWSADEAAIAAAVAATGFDRLADQEKRLGFAERAERTERFFASGRTGGWREMLSTEQATRIERAQGEVMARFGYL